jgi:aminocarboxymuconate-semialdehyde decarboxylase
LKKPPAETIRTFYWDTILHSQPQLEFLVKEFGAAKVILGSDYPYDMGTFECPRQVKALSCGEMDKLTILNGLVQKLLAGVK